jgi:hypothetical protein
MIKCDLNTNIYRPLQQVFAFVITPENDFHWQYGTLMSSKISEGEMALGSLFRVVGHCMGWRMESVYEVTEFEPNKRYGFKSLSGPMDLSTLYTFEILKRSTKICISAQISLGEPFKSNPMNAERTIKKEYRENLALLKEILESSRTERPPGGAMLVPNRRRSDAN